MVMVLTEMVTVLLVAMVSVTVTSRVATLIVMLTVCV